MIHSRMIILLLITLICSKYVFAQKEDIHTPDQILKIMENSSLVYEISSDYNLDSTTSSFPVLSNQLFISKDSLGNKTLSEYKISPEANELLINALKFYKNGQGGKANGCYAKVKKLEPNYYHLFTLVGDKFYYDSQYVSAKQFFKTAIKLNFIDYDAHWFLADTYHKLGIKDSMLMEITTAHLLNINHKYIRQALINYRKQNGQEWKEWNFEPQYIINKKGNNVIIKAPESWLAYAMVKAVWQYEPDYAERMLGNSNGKNLTSNIQEREAVLAYLATDENHKYIPKIIKDGFIDEFILYEIVGKQYPSAILLFDQKVFNRLIEYVNNYH